MQIRKCIALILCLVPLWSAEAQTRKSARVRALEQERNKMLKQIESTDKQLKNIKHNARTEQRQLELVRRQKAQRTAMLRHLGVEIAALQGDIDSLASRVRSLHSREQQLLEQYKRSILALGQGMQREDQLLFIFSSPTLEQGLQRKHFLSRYASSSRRTAQELHETREEIEAKQRELTTNHESKLGLLALRDRERKKLESEEHMHSSQIRTLKGKEEALAQELKKQRSEATALEQKIEQQIAYEIEQEQRRRAEAKRRAEARRRAEAKRRAEARRKAEAQRIAEERRHAATTPASPTEVGEETLEEETRPAEEASTTKSRSRGRAKAAAREAAEYEASEAMEIKLSGSFTRNKGRLPMPVRGRYTITRFFGLQKHNEHSRVQVSSGGIDIRPSSDRRAYAVFDGVVRSIFATPGYGTSILVRHGDYLTSYSNLSSINVRQGQKVKAGAVLGSISTAGMGDRAGTLHFQLWRERTKQNPLLWLKR